VTRVQACSRRSAERQSPSTAERSSYPASKQRPSGLNAAMRYGAWASVLMAKFWLVGVEIILCLHKKRPGLVPCGTRVLSEPEPPFLWLTVQFNDSLDLPVGQVNGPGVHPGVTSVLPLCLGRRRDVRADYRIFHTLFTADSRNEVLNCRNRGACPP
jgi:hypothetical protein